MAFEKFALKMNILAGRGLVDVNWDSEAISNRIRFNLHI